MSLQALAERMQLGGATDVRQNEFLLRATIDNHEFTVFPDGRAIIKGTQNEAEAATLYARYIGM
jgi:adenylyltransferase/sulfurtransferase